MTVAIIDYGSGNLRSAAKAFERAAAERGVGQRVVVTDEARAVAGADRIVLPGVGAFADCKRGLAALPGMIETLNREVAERGKPFFGICVGMQLMAERGLEHGVHEGLGWIKGEVRMLEPADPALKIPHMGWNDLRPRPPVHPVLQGIDTGSDAYFVHSYHFACTEAPDVLAEVDYGGPVTALIGRDNMVGSQFHPEKSQEVGLRLIANFLAWRP
ncbi:MAG: imidazole glycerol phosphate synthase subunit HisH [Alphaproteobacteria bacterium]